MPPYWRLDNSCEASEKYACVTSAVAAIPMPATRAPRAYELLAAVNSHEQHGPRKRRPDLLDLPVLREQRPEADLRPVVHVAGRVAERPPVRAPRHVHNAPDRLARPRPEQPARGDAGHLRERLLGLGNVLQHLDGRRHVELVVGEREPRGLLRSELEVRPAPRLPLGAQLRVVEVDADDAARLEALRPLAREHALAAADVEYGARRGDLPQLVERAVEAGHEPLDHGIRGAVLVVRIAGRDGLLRLDRAHASTSTGSRSLPVAGPASAPVVGGCSVWEAPGS